MLNKLNYVIKLIKYVIVMKVCFNIFNWFFCKEKENNVFYLNFVLLFELNKDIYKIKICVKLYIFFYK